MMCCSLVLCVQLALCERDVLDQAKASAKYTEVHGCAAALLNQACALQACTKGTFADGVNFRTECQLCPAGSISTMDNATSCQVPTPEELDVMV
jgi:hypothetical protein